MVVYALNSAQIGGGERSMLTLWDAIRDLEVMPRAVLPEDGPMAEACRRAGVAHQVGPLRGPSLDHPLRSIRETVLWTSLARKSALVHSNDPQAARAVAFGAWSANRAHVCHVRFPEGPEFYAWVFRGLPRPDVFILNSVAMERQIAPHLKRACPVSRIHVIHNGVDLTSFRPSDGQNRSGIIGIVANLLPVKGHRTFLQMARILTQSGTDARYWVVGGDIHHTGYEGDLRSLCDELGLRDRVEFLGHRGDVAELMRQMDIVVVASHVEPFGRTAIEAMACAKPVVATAVGGLPEIVVHEETGLLVPPENPVELAGAVAALWESDALRRRMGEAGRARAEKHFSARAHAKRVYDVYADLW